MRAKDKAVELWLRHNLSIPVDLKQLAIELGLEVVTFPFTGRLKEVIIDNFIGIRPGTSQPWLRWYIAHAIGHHEMHVGAGFYLEAWQWVNHAKAERQAEEFAVWLLAGPSGWQLSHEELAIPKEKLHLVRALAEKANLDANSNL